MPDIALESFKGVLFDICRPNRFTVNITGNETIEFDEGDYYFVKGASLPGKTMGEIELNWQGHKYKILGDPTFSDVTITFWNDESSDSEEQSVRSKFEDWLAIASDDVPNVRGNHEDYKCTVTISQLNGNGDVVKEYNLIYAHPKELSAIELSMDSTDAVEEFTVVFSYSYLEISEFDNPVGGSSGGGSGGSGSSGIFGGGSGSAAGGANPIKSLLGGIKTVSSVIRGAGKIVNATKSLSKSVKGIKKLFK